MVAQEVVRVRKEGWISKDARYVVSSARHDKLALPYFLTGEGELYQSTQCPYAFHTRKDDNNSCAIVDLGENRTVTKIYIQNRSGDPGLSNRADTLAVWLALRPTDFGNPVWQAKQAQREWFIKLPPTKARYVRFGLRRKEVLHLKHVKIIGY